MRDTTRTGPFNMTRIAEVKLSLGQRGLINSSRRRQERLRPGTVYFFPNCLSTRLQMRFHRTRPFYETRAEFISELRGIDSRQETERRRETGADT